MSTDLGSIKGLQLPNMGIGQCLYIHINRFPLEETSLGHQLTIGTTFIQLSEEAVADVAFILLSSLAKRRPCV